MLYDALHQLCSTCRYTGYGIRSFGTFQVRMPFASRSKSMRKKRKNLNRLAAKISQMPHAMAKGAGTLFSFSTSPMFAQINSITNRRWPSVHAFGCLGISLPMSRKVLLAMINPRDDRVSVQLSYCSVKIPMNLVAAFLHRVMLPMK